jgi:alpha-amylase
MQIDTHPHSLTVAVFAPPVAEAAPRQHYVGDGRDIILQGFHWRAHRGAGDGRRSWYRVLQENAGRIRAAGFTLVWFPPPSDSLSPDGYMPRRWNAMDTAYGSRDELRGAIEALAPVKCMADVVVNHRVGVGTPGPDFADPPFPDNRAAVTRDDPCGAGTGNADTGEEQCPMGRELDHTNPTVRAAIKNYMRQLRALGFCAWRYDFSKGYHGRFVAEYNDASAPVFSVGEYFDGDRQKLAHWIDRTGGKSAAFDFPLRFRLYEACTRDDYSGIRSNNYGREVLNGLVGFWPSHAVTFVENHDTEHTREEEHLRNNQDIRHFPGKHVAQAYAFLLTHPGVPCVYWQHLFDWDTYTQHRLERLIHVRREVNLHASASVHIHEAGKGLYAATVEGRLAVKLGSRSWSPGHGWRLAVDGDQFAVWTRG